MKKLTPQNNEKIRADTQDASLHFQSPRKVRGIVRQLSLKNILTREKRAWGNCLVNYLIEPRELRIFCQQKVSERTIIYLSENAKCQFERVLLLI